MNDTVKIRTFRPDDAEALPAAWQSATPPDTLTARRFRDLVLLDRNFDADGLFVAEQGGRITGAGYAVRRRVAHDGADTEPDQGWIPFLFEVPDAPEGTARELVACCLAWLRDQGAQQVGYGGYTPNYVVPGLDAVRFPGLAQVLTDAGFRRVEDAVAMERSLREYRLPSDIAERVESLRRQGFVLASPADGELPELIEVAGGRFNPDWGRGIREAVLAGLPLERIVMARGPQGRVLGWAMCATYEHVIDRFGPFGVVEESRGTGLGEVLLHLTLARMQALGAHRAWFLWTDLDSPAGHLYRKAGFAVTRTFTVLRADLGAGH